MSKENQVIEKDHNEVVVEKAKDFWSKYQRPILIASALIILIAGGFIGYKKFYKEPLLAKAEDALFKAEEYYRKDSLQKALNGDLINPGFVKVISKYGNTPAGNLARFYAADCYARTGDFAKAEQYITDFHTDQKMLQATAYKLHADILSEQGKNDKAIELYKKAAGHFTEDKENSAVYLSMAALLCEETGKTKEAIELFKELKEKFPRTAAGSEADKYLGKLGGL